MEDSSFIFLSYSSTDSDIANQIVEFLELKGITCWMAPRDIDPGDDWAESIMLALKNCSTMVLLLSERSNNSVQVRREVEQAVRYRHPIITIRTEQLEPSLALQYYISAHHWVDASDGDLERHLKRVATILRKKTGIKSTTPKDNKGIAGKSQRPGQMPTQKSLDSSGRRAKLDKRKLTIFLPAVILVLAAVFVLGIFKNSISDSESNVLTDIGIMESAVGLSAQDMPVAIALVLASFLPDHLSSEAIDSIAMNYPAVALAAAFRSDLDSSTKAGVMHSAASIMLYTDTLPSLRLKFLEKAYQMSSDAEWGSALEINTALLLGQHYRFTLEKMPCTPQTAAAFTQHMQHADQWYATCLHVADEYDDMEAYSQACLWAGHLYELFANRVARIPVPEEISDNDEAIAAFYEELGSQFYLPKLDQIRQVYVTLLQRAYEEGFGNRWTAQAEQYLAAHYPEALADLRDEYDIPIEDDGRPDKP